MSADAEWINIVRNARKKERRKGFWTNLAAWLTASAVLALINGWMVMLVVQIIHSHVWPNVAGIGYWWSVLICFLLKRVEWPKDKND